MRNPENTMKWTVKIAWFISMILVGYLSLTPYIDIPCPFSGTDKIVHLLGYAWLAILPFFAFAKTGTAFTGAFLMVPLGIGLEFAQRYVPGREFSIPDMMANSAGVVSGIVLARYAAKGRRIINASPGYRKMRP